jgi:hypothetical protein
VGKEQEQRKLVTVISRVHQDAPLAEEVGKLFQQDIAQGQHERMAGMDHACEGEARAVTPGARHPW